MIDHGIVKSAIRPEPMVVDDFSVWVASDIHPVTETVMDIEFKGFEFHLIQYDKDEYIHLLDKQNKETSRKVTDTQLALTEIYEMMV